MNQLKFQNCLSKITELKCSGIHDRLGTSQTPSGVPVEEDRVSAVGAADRDVIYHINGKEVTKEEWT